jgi:protein-disulfide isomerase
MKTKKWVKALGVMSLALGLFFACNKEANSKASYIFKAAPSEGAVANIGGEVIMAKDFYKGVEADLFEAEMKVYEIKFARLQTILLERFMSKDPNKKNLSNDEFLAKYIAKDIKVADKEIEKFIVDRQIPKEQINPEIKDRIKQYIEMDKKKEAVEKWLAEQVNKTKVEVYIEKPKRPVFDVNIADAPFKGNADAKVTIVEYSDFQCPFCSKASKTVEELEKKYGNKVKIAFKNFPLPFHNQAKMAAMAAECANVQDKKYFWKMHDAMFADQTKLDRDQLLATAKKIGVKVEEFTKCLDSNAHMAKIDQDIKEGQELAIKSTPTFFINGKLLSGALPIETFSEVIEEELAK